jgi:diguanylate cyclase (GGDEF)-like protein
LRMLGFIPAVSWSSKRLPDAVFAELVDIIFTSLPPVALIGVVLTGVGILVGTNNNDPVIWGACRFRRGRHRRADCADPDLSTPSESRGRARRRDLGEPLCDRRLQLRARAWRVQLARDRNRRCDGCDVGHETGIVARLGVRPAICVISLALAVVPTAIGYLSYAASAGSHYVTAMYTGQAVLLIVFAVAGTEAMGHIYRTTLQQLLTRHDLAMLAGQDGLTGLPNRTLLRARLNEGTVQMRRGATMLAFHCLDLDHFKSVNDSLGHAAGDALLKSVAERLNGTLRIGDTVARVGGDEFVVLQVGILREDEARLLAHRIVRALSAAYVIDGHEVRIGATVGIALAPRDGVTLDHLAARADAALYQAKHKGRGSVVVAGDTPTSGAAATAA